MKANRCIEDGASQLITCLFIYNSMSLADFTSVKSHPNQTVPISMLMLLFGSVSYEQEK